MSGCRVVVDSREYNTAQDVVEELKGLGCEVIVSTLAVGDYVLSSEVAVERKRAMDLVNSIIDGRLFEQAEGLVEEYQEPYILIEGDLWVSVANRGISANAVVAALAKVSRMGVKTLWTMDESSTAYAIYSLATATGGVLKVVGRRKSMPIRELQIGLLASLPGIGVRRAVKLLKIYGTPLNALTNYRQWSSRLGGLSPSTMFMIRKVLEGGYNGGKDKDGVLNS